MKCNVLFSQVYLCTSSRNPPETQQENLLICLISNTRSPLTLTLFLTSCSGTVKISLASSYEQISSRHSRSRSPSFSSSRKEFARRTRRDNGRLASDLLRNTADNDSVSKHRHTVHTDEKHTADLTNTRPSVLDAHLTEAQSTLGRRAAPGSCGRASFCSA